MPATDQSAAEPAQTLPAIAEAGAAPEQPLPCPFCGGAPRVLSHMEEDPGHQPFEAWVSITCDNCGIEMGDEYRSDIVTRWNTRTTLAQEPR